MRSTRTTCTQIPQQKRSCLITLEVAEEIELARAEGDDGFSSHFQELLGDALVANGDLEGARQAYQEALKGVTADSQAGRLITAKMNMTRKGDDG